MTSGIPYRLYCTALVHLYRLKPTSMSPRRALILETLVSFALLVSQAVACNGSDALCSRRYSNVTHVGAHDSAFVGFFPTDNQYTSASDVLNMGVRFLQAQTHSHNAGIEMCHTSCLELDAGSLQSYLAPIKDWLDRNPNEVVTLLLTNQDAIPRLAVRVGLPGGRAGSLCVLSFDHLGLGPVAHSAVHDRCGAIGW